MSEASKVWLISFQHDIVLRIALNVVRKHILHQLVFSIERQDGTNTFIGYFPPTGNGREIEFLRKNENALK